MSDQLFGVDAASSQGNVDWTTADKTIAYGWEKATQGTGYTNPYWAKAKAAMADRAKATGFVPGAYLFLEHGNGAAQAQHFATVAGNLDGFGLAVDVEPWPGGGSYPTMADAAACVTKLRQLYPHHPIGGYIPHWYWGSQDTTFADYLWASHYVTGTGTPAQLYAHVPASFWDDYGGAAIRILQFTSTAQVPGVAGLCDCSAFRSTADRYKAMVLPAVPPPALPSGIYHADGHTSIRQLATRQGVGVPAIWWATVAAQVTAGSDRFGDLQWHYLNASDWQALMPQGMILWLP